MSRAKRPVARVAALATLIWAVAMVLAYAQQVSPDTYGRRGNRRR